MPDFRTPESANEAILQNFLGADNDLREPQSVVEYYLQAILEQGLAPEGSAIKSTGATAGKVLTANGEGGASWEETGVSALSTADVDAIWNGGFSITTTITNGTASGANKILFGTVQITITPNTGYETPTSVSVTGADASYDEYSGVITLTNATGNVTITAECEEIPMPTPKTLDEMTWDEIKIISDASAGASYFSVGDCKQITLNGTVGTLTLDNLSTCVYILGFDHNSAVEGTGISFGGFKTAVSDGINVALCDSHYSITSTNGSKWFNMNHSVDTNSGGWKGCDMRYDILGSVEVKNQQDATSAATSSPVANTLMAALSSDLRAVLKPITKWTDNVGGGSDTASNVTTTVDYLPLLAEHEVTGGRKFANSTELLHQAQYAFYANGNSKVKYDQSSTSSAVFYWLRSVNSDALSNFCIITTDGGSGNNGAVRSRGVSPVFLV